MKHFDPVSRYYVFKIWLSLLTKAVLYLETGIGTGGMMVIPDT